MKLIILGSGTAAPVLNRNCAGYILEVDNKKLLFDSGAGTIRRLLELKIDLFAIEHIFYTHLHNDHINDLGAIIWSNNYGGTREKPLNLYGPEGFKNYFKVLLEDLLKPTKIYFKINLKELTNSIIKIGNATIKTMQIKHSATTKSIAYRIEHKNKSIVYTGDTEYCKETIEIAKNADVLITECSLPDNEEIEGHLTPSLAGKIASKAQVKTLMLTHFYPQVLKTNIKKQCRKEFGGRIILAKDKMRLTV
ncbi:MBL fold metallo-hydrolase [Candidatus Woesearchaeota archaeon]|nr:MBL fold metallo-hydrolase [Candidatus Woesearchaeota archaeon]